MNNQLVSEFQRRAEAAEKKLAQLQARIAVLEQSAGTKTVKTGLRTEDEKEEAFDAPKQRVCALKSTMNDDYQLIIRKLMDRGPRVQPNSEVLTAIAGGGYHRMTWLQVQKRGTQLASALSKMGVKPGDRVGTFMWNNGRHLQLYYALPSMGAILHTINIRLSPKELQYIITHAQV